MAMNLVLSASATGLTAITRSIYDSATKARVNVEPARWTRSELESLISSGEPGAVATQVLAPAAGLPLPWQPTFQVYKGQANLATGNLTLSHAVTGWTALGSGVNLVLHYNSQSTRIGSLGVKWTHSYETRIVGSNPAILIQGDGTEVSYALQNGVYQTPAGFHESLTRSASGVWTLTFKDGSTQTFDSSGRLSALTDVHGNATTLSYGASGLQSVTDAVGRSLTFTYGSGRLTTITDPEGKTWSVTYGASRLSGVVDPLLNGTSSTTSFGWNSNDLVTSVTDRLGSTWNYAYGANAAFYTVTDPFNKVAGSVNAVPAGPDTTGFSSQSAAGASTPDNVQSTYPVNTITTAYVQDAGGNAREYGLDNLGRITATRDGTGHQTNFTWDTQNNRTSIVEPGGATTSIVYDSRGNVTSVTDATGRTSSKTYDANNNLLSEEDFAGNDVVYAYDLKNNVTSITDATNRTETRTYNPNGTLATSTDGEGKTTTFTYNPAGDLASEINPLGQTMSWSYSLGRLTSRTDGLGRATTNAYDAWKRLSAIDYPQSTDQSFTYDRENRLVQSVDGTGTRTYSYDLLGRKTQQVDPRGTTAATYDFAGRLKTQTDPTGRLIQYAYNGDGQLTGVSDPNVWVSYSYDSSHRVSTATYSNGTTSTYGYDLAGRTVSLVHRSAGNTVLGSYSSTYDASGRLSQIVEGPQAATTTFGYDGAGRLLSETRTGVSPYNSTYTYNSRGLRASALRSENGVLSHNGTYTYDNAGQLTSVIDTVGTSGLGGTYTWNADGTLASLPGSGFTRTLSYDEEGRLISVSKVQGATTTLQFQYGYGFDGGRRWRKDIVNNVWDWYPCGVACCAGDLVTLRSVNAGSTWSVLEKRLDKSSLVDGVPFLGNGGSGAQRIGSEQAVTDSFGVRRAGSFGTGINSVLNPLRGDADIEGTLRQLGGPKKPESQLDCEKKLELCTRLADSKKDTCNQKCNVAAGVCAVLCGAVCAGSLGLGCGFCLGACSAVLWGCYDMCGKTHRNDLKYCYDAYKKCKAGNIKPKPSPVGSTARVD